MMYYYGYNGFWPFHIFGAILSALFWIFLIILFIRLIRHSRHGRGFHFRDSAMETLRERYVKGEITKEQFEEMRKELMK